jgi:nucleotidyltransferase/DNA polymerase involved in DNA repair
MAVEELEDVWGLGPKGAEKLYRKGIKSVEELKKNQHMLTEMQKIGLKYYKDFLQRMPRSEVEKIYETVKAACFEVVS